MARDPEPQPAVMDAEAEHLRAFATFSNVSDEDITSLGADLQLRSYAARQRIFDLGDPAVGLYLIKSGKVKVFRVSREGSEQVLGVFNDGEEFALAAVFHGGAYPASAETLEPSKIYFLEREALLRHIGREPELALRLLSSMSKKLQGLVSLIDSLSLKDARGRLAQYLTTLMRPEAQAPMTVDLPMSKTLLSQHLGVKMETLSRTFRGLVDEGLLGSIKQGHIVIRDVQGIRKAAGGQLD